MEKNEKKLVATIAVSFAAGIATTLTVLSLCCCPMHHHGHKRHGMRPMPQIEMRGDVKGLPMANHHQKDKHFKHRHHKHGFDGKPFEPTAEMKERFAQKLGLTDEQKQKLDEMRQADMAKMEPLFKQMKELHQQMDELRKVNRGHFESVLTDGQKEILQQMKKERMEKHSH